MNDHDGQIYNVQFITSTVHAGFPSPASDYEERSLNLNDLVVEHAAATYFMRVAGESIMWNQSPQLTFTVSYGVPRLQE